jgi:GNAT superfamily N-acetyltransferase
MCRFVRRPRRGRGLVSPPRRGHRSPPAIRPAGFFMLINRRTETPVQPITLKPADGGDADSVRELVRAAYAKWIPVIGREPRPMTVDYRTAIAEHDVLLAHADTTLAGIIETMICGDHVWIENLAVLPAFQGKGVGRQLLDTAEDLARRAGLPEVRLLTNAAFAENVAFYERRGFRVTKEEPFMGGTTLYFARHLDG